MPNPARLIIARDLTNASDFHALDLDTHKEAIIDKTEVANVYADCHAWDSEALDHGLCAQTTMSAENWALWLAGFELVEPADDVFLTLSPAGEFDDCIAAMGLSDWISSGRPMQPLGCVEVAKLREAIAPPDEKAAMLADLIGFDADRFEQGYSVVARMTAQNWELWLEHFEVSELSAESAALLGVG